MRRGTSATTVARMPTARRDVSLLVDVGPVLALTAAGLATRQFRAADDFLMTMALVVVPLLARRWFPVIVLVVVAVGSVVTAIQTGGPWIQITAVAVASLTLGDRSE